MLRHETAVLGGRVRSGEERLNGITDGDHSRFVQAPENQGHKDNFNDVGCNN